MIGIASPFFCSIPFPKMVKEISEHFSLWEVLSEGEDMLSRIGDDLRSARDTLGMEFQVHAAMSDVNLGSVHEPMRQAAVSEIRGTIAACRDLEIPVVTIHPGFVNGIAFLDRSRALEMTRRSVHELAPVAEEHGITLALENLPANINATCTKAQDLLEVIEGTSVAICFDMGHANTSGELDNMLREVSRFANVHLHNNEGKWDQHNRIDDGTADLERVLAVLKKSYSGNLIIEATDLEQGVESKAILERLLEHRATP
jgi:sugar phosphate isomerase/epimerase